MSSNPPSTPKPPAGPSTPPPRPGPKHREPMASTAEVAEYFGVSVKTLYDWRLHRKGPKASKVGKHLRFKWADVERWAEQQAVAA